MKKKIAVTILLAVACVCSCLLLSACDGKGSYTYHEVSTLEQLYSMKSDEAYKLTADIDFEGREWTPRSVVGFNGQGHTISNVAITVDEKATQTAFFKSCRWLENVTFDGCTIMGDVYLTYNSLTMSKYPTANIAIGSSISETVENVTVKNCSIDINRIDGGVCVGLVAATIGYGGDRDDTSIPTYIKNCKVYDCSVKSNFVSIFGGITSELLQHINDPSVSNCTVKGLDVKTNSLNIGGGIVGRVLFNYGKISNCCVYEMTIKSGTVLGGIAGNCALDILGCKSEKIELNSNSAAPLSVNIAMNGAGMGGIVGHVYFEGIQINNCLSVNNTFNYNNNGSAMKYIGGLVGAAQETAQTTVRSCLSINNTYNVESNNFICCDTVGWIKKGTVIFCGSYGNEFNGDTSHHYVANVANSGVAECYSDYDNDVMRLLSKEKWLDKSELSVFKLDEKIWTLKDGELPNIQF